MKNGKRKFGDDAKNWDDDKDLRRPSKLHGRRNHSTARKTNDSRSTSKTDGGSFKGSVYQFVHSWRVWVAALIIIIAVAVPFVWIKGVKPAIDKHNINNDPKLRESNAAILPYDHKWIKTPLNKSSVDDANVNDNQMVIKQKSDEAGDTTCLVFHAEGKDNPQHTIKITGAFGDPKTRDFFNAQQPVLEKGMRSGKTKVQVCMLLTKDEYSALATEALGEIDYNNPQNTWRGLNALLRVDSSGLTTSDARLGSVMNVVNSLPNVDSKVKIRKESLKNGSFLQWARMMTNDNSVDKIPALWIDGKNYSDNTKYRITNPDWLMNLIINLK